ncbi:MAG: hypothetical protein HZA49_02075 [Planctomycetes bacterium]|nr:hypothetical protein [Planctomycetota bacterium]
MNFSEYHSHKWSKNLSEVKRQAKEINETNDIAKAKEKLTLLYNGDFSRPDKIFPGLKVMAVFWKAEEEMMRCRFEAKERAAQGLHLTDTDEFRNNLKNVWLKYTDDITELVKKNSLLDDKQAGPIIKKYPPQMGANWSDVLKDLMSQTEEAAKKGEMPDTLTDNWLAFCLDGILAYNFGLARQAVLSAMIINKFSEEKLKQIVEASRDEYGWLVSKKFFVEVFPAAGITDMTDLQTIGRYGMFSDQDLTTSETLPPPDKRASEPKVKRTEFFNCQEFSMFETTFKILGVKVKFIGIAMCPYCEEHGKKNVQVFVPPSMRPEVRMTTSLGMGNKSCVFETKLYPADDMERFMQAQEKVFGGQF